MFLKSFYELDRDQKVVTYSENEKIITNPGIPYGTNAEGMS